jgi:hypothetical protein
MRGQLMRSAVVIALATAGLPLAYAQNQERRHDHHATRVSAPIAVPITITINPEARVSVAETGELSQTIACDRTVELPVKIVNEGAVTAPLEASLVAPPEGVSLVFTQESLSGAQEERRILRVTLKRKAKFVSITIAFRAKHDISDLGGRDRIHVLLRCIR